MGARVITRLLLGVLVTAPLLASAAPSKQRIARSLRVVAGPNVNDFVQTDKLTVHTVVRTDARRPRVLFATPAGNSGIGLWFKPMKGKGLTLEESATPVDQGDLHGVSLTLSGPAHLELERVMLDSMRALRDKDHGAEGARDALVKDALALFDSAAGERAGATPEMVARLKGWVEPEALRDPERPGALILERRALGSGARYRIEIVPAAGTTVVRRNGTIELEGAAGTRFTVRSFIDRTPLTPLASVLSTSTDAGQQRNLGLLVYKEKFLAGSYQYLTYFGRDTMISSKLLGERLSPEALGTALGSVLDRISPHGRVAHEESNGDQATLEALPGLMKAVRSGRGRITPARVRDLEHEIHDYKMMDGEFLLPPLLADYAQRVSAKTFSHTMTPARLDALARVVSRILDETGRFEGGSVSDLLHLRRGQIVGNWRDSGEGLGNGRTPLDVNAYLVPAALESLEKLIAQPGFPRDALVARLTQRRPDARAALSTLAARATSWKSAARKFEVALGAGEARSRVSSYLASYPAAEQAALGAQKLWSGKTVAEALRGTPAPELDGGVRFPGVSLDGRGKPTPVLSSDEAFHLFYGNPERDALVASVTRLFQPFPVGLMTPVGMVVANPAYSNRAEDRTLFDRDHYHGAVVWSWPQTMMRRGLEKQLARFAGDEHVTAVLQRALGQLDEVDRQLGAMKSAELWTWKIEGGRVVPEAFGASAQHTTEGAALQLWSNTY